MKSTQIVQSMQYVYYQVYWLSTKDTVTSPLSLHRAGNNSDAVFDQAQTAIDQFLSSSEMFASARLYDLELNTVVESTNNATNLSFASESVLYPLQKSSPVPKPIINGISASSDSAIQGYFTGPLPNSTDSLNTTYYMGITLPVYSNSSIILSKATIAGYFTVIATASVIQNSLQYLTNKHDNEYVVSLIRRFYQNSTSAGDPNALIGFDLVFPSELDYSMTPNVFHPLSESPDMKGALTSKNGISKKAKSLTGKEVAMGYSAVNVDSHTYWTVLVQQNRSTFMSPVRHLTKIMVGVVIGIGAFMCLITFPLAVWFVIPITKLKEATEAITKSKKERDKTNHGPGSKAPPKPSDDRDDNNRSINQTFNEDHDQNQEQEKTIVKRNSVNTVASSMTAYSTGIRLPDKIPQSKKLFKDELTELQDAFNIMTEELEKQYSHLEDRVKVRTKELEESKIEAEAANEAKTVFIANISHELRTPLNGILGMTSIAMEDKDPQLIHDSLKLIHRSGELLLHILTELLTYSKNTLNRSKLEKSNFQVLEILYQVKSIFGKLAIDQRVNLRISLRPNFLRTLILYGDSNRIIQVVMNLVSNSLKFTPIMGSVEVNFKLLGEYDQERSKAANYEKVYVKENAYMLAPANENEEVPNKDPILNLQEPFNSGLDQLLAENDHASIALEQQEQKNEADVPDNQSLTTVSTAEFEHHIFKSQFDDDKALPNLPPGSIRSSRRHRVRRERPDEGNNDSNRDLLLLNDADGNTEKTSFVDAEASMNNGLISSSELVKNNKVYKMRKLYVPRSWAVQIEVKDTGSGIEPELQEKVFEPFIQGDQSLSRSYGGTGLGLSICRQLAKMMHGTLTLKSAIGKGSTFTFTVPLPQQGEIVVPDEEMEEFSNDIFNPDSKVNRKVSFDVDDEKQDTATSSSGQEPSKYKDSHEEKEKGSENESSSDSTKSSISKKPSYLDIHATANGEADNYTSTPRSTSADSILSDVSKNIRILVAEDNTVNQEVIKRMLRLEGYKNITMASNGLESVELVKKSYESMEPYNIIFMDVQMPKMDGLTATQLIRNNLLFKKPIIALTAFADESNVKECLNAGMSGFLSKPIKRMNLRQIMKEFGSDVYEDSVMTTWVCQEYCRGPDVVCEGR